MNDEISNLDFSFIGMNCVSGLSETIGVYTDVFKAQL